MIDTLALLILAATQPPERTTLPRQLDPQPYEQQENQEGKPTDPLFDRELVATDDSAFIVAAVEGVRQSAIDARSAERVLADPSLKATASAIGTQSEVTLRTLEML